MEELDFIIDGVGEPEFLKKASTAFWYVVACVVAGISIGVAAATGLPTLSEGTPPLTGTQESVIITSLFGATVGCAIAFGIWIRVTIALICHAYVKKLIAQPELPGDASNVFLLRKRRPPRGR